MHGLQQVFWIPVFNTTLEALFNTSLLFFWNVHLNNNSLEFQSSTFGKICLVFLPPSTFNLFRKNAVSRRSPNPSSPWQGLLGYDCRKGALSKVLIYIQDVLGKPPYTEKMTASEPQRS